METTASFLALPVPCVPGPREDVPDRESLGTRMDNFSKIIMKWTRQPDLELLREILPEEPFEQPKDSRMIGMVWQKIIEKLNCEVFSTPFLKDILRTNSAREIWNTEEVSLTL